MMRKLFVFCLLVGIAYAQVAIELQTLEPGEPERCKDGDKVYKVGDKWKPEDECLIKSCSRYSKPGVMAVHYAGCGKIISRPKSCKLSKQDASKSFPECCPKMTCS